MTGWDPVHGPHQAAQVRTVLYFRYAERGLAVGLLAGFITGTLITMRRNSARKGTPWSRSVAQATIW